MRRVPWQERFWSKVAVKGPDDCWLWKPPPMKCGYGRIYGRENGKRVSLLAHRAVLMLLGADLADGEVVDHECHNRDLSCPGGFACVHRRCVNPAHLVITSQMLNSQNAMARIQNCPRGHTKADAYVYVGESGAVQRICRHCRSEDRPKYKRNKVPT